MKQSLFRRGRYWQAKIQLDGWPREKRVSLQTSDKRVAQSKLLHLVEEAEKEANGILPLRSVRVANSRTFLEHVDALLSDLRTRGKSKNTIRAYSTMLRRLSKDCGWVHLADVSVRSFCEWRQDCGLHGETVNDYHSALSRFFSWLRRQRCVLENPVEYVERVDTRASAKEYRRALNTEEVARLLETTANPRRVIYRMVVETGLRRCELQGLRWADFRLGAGVGATPDRPEAVAPEDCFPTASGVGSVRVQASISKNRRTVVLPLGPALVEGLVALRGDAAPFQLAFNGLVPKLPRFRKDLSAAGIVFVDESGRRADLHALRKTFGTALVLSGAEPRVVMEAMRHSDLKLTMKTYMDAAQLTGPVGAAVKLLPWNKPEASVSGKAAEISA
jgi:integrase